MTDTVHTLPRMRGIKEALEEIKALDPETALTYTALRRFVLTGKIPHIKAGRKYLINMDALTDYLYQGTDGAELTASGGGIRKIAE